MLENLIQSLLSDEISDIFIAANKMPYVRINGKVVAVEEVEVISNASVVEFRERYLQGIAVDKYREHGAYDAAVTIEGRRYRINFYETLTGSAMALRPLKDGASLYFADLNLPSQIETLSQYQRGLILISGSTGSGKSTTLAAMINYINRNYNKHILTIEDPIEFLHSNEESLVSQREINLDSSSFAESMRSAMRENPDVIVIGEMRDTETMQAAINAALTGHLVISTVHTADSTQAVERIVNVFPQEQRHQVALDLSLALVGISAQRLIPAVSSNRMQIACEILLGTPLVKKLIANQSYSELEFAISEGSHLGMISFTRSIFKLYQDGKISLEDALNYTTNREELNLLLKGMESGVDAFRTFYGQNADSGNDLIDMARLLRSAIKYKSSDLILSVGAPPSVRLDGIIRHMELPILSDDDTQRLLYGIINQHQRIIFEENRELDFALAVGLNLSDNNDAKDELFRFRINAFFQRGSIGIVARVIQSHIPTPVDLKLPEVLLSLIEKQQGLILVTGPTGSGKTTTLASLVDQVNRKREAHIITIEDPIEYVHSNKNSIVEQRELNSDTKDFATALKYTLRQDPDVIMVGEMRDIETIAAALTAAETGHLVLATIHTNNAPQTIDRIVDSFPSSQQNQIKLQLAGVILGIVSQRLLPKKNGTGRVAAFEVMVGTSAVQALVREGKTHQLQSMIETGFRDGMQTLEKSLEQLYNQGLIDYKETLSFKINNNNNVNFLEK